MVITSSQPPTGSGASSGEQRNHSATQLRAMWRTASRDRGWAYPDDWWTPAVDAVTEAVVSDGDIAERCRRLGRARAIAGVSMAETIDDVLAMAGLVRSLQAHPTHHRQHGSVEVDVVDLVKAAAVGWSEQFTLAEADLSSESVTALADCGYMSVRFGEIAAQSEAQGSRMGQQYALVVASLIGPSRFAADELAGLQERVEAWDRTWQMTQLAADLRSVFSSGETIVQSGPTTAIVLARRCGDLQTRVSSLRALLAGRRPDDAPGGSDVRVWVEGLPDDLCQARQLLDDLRR